MVACAFILKPVFLSVLTEFFGHSFSFSSAWMVSSVMLAPSRGLERVSCRKAERQKIDRLFTLVPYNLCLKS